MCHGCLYGNELTLEKMRRNPINTAAGKSRKTPQDPRRPKHPRTHILAGFDTPTINHLQVVSLKRRRNPSG